MTMMFRKLELKRELAALLEKMARPQPMAVLLARMQREYEIRAQLEGGIYKRLAMEGAL